MLSPLHSSQSKILFARLMFPLARLGVSYSLSPLDTMHTYLGGGGGEGENGGEGV